MRATRATVWGLVVLTAVLAGAGQAQEAETTGHTAAAWLDRAAAALADVPLEEDPYAKADLTFWIMKAETMAGRDERSAALFGELQKASMMITLQEADAWSSAFLPGGHLLAGRADEAQRAAENLAFDAAIHLDAWQILAEAADAAGDDAVYDDATAKMMALIPKVTAEGVEAAKQEEMAYAGIGSAWYAGNTMRQRGDVENLRRLATAGLTDPMEQAGVSAMLAQVELIGGDADAARAALDKAFELTDLAAKRNHEDAEQDTYWPEAANMLPEIVAAAWVLDGPEAAAARGEAWGELFADEGPQWECAAALHAAEVLRQTRQAEAGRAALTAAVAALDRETEGLMFETVWTARELVLQGRADEAEALAAISGPAAFRSSIALGVAEGLIVLDAAP
ncbi:MAG: hypothetical protein AAF333_05295 [Planctomycetota bacterium]